MGLAVVILIQLAGIFILSLFFAFVSCLITYFVAGKERQKKKLLLAAFSPFVALYTLYFTAIVGSGVVSYCTGVDIGIGDGWYVPLSKNCDLAFIDVAEQSYIQFDDDPTGTDVSEIAQAGNMVYARTDSGTYFSLDLNSRQRTNMSTSELKKASGDIKLIEPITFYVERKNKIAGVPLIIVGILSLCITALSVYILKRILLGRNRRSVA